MPNAKNVKNVIAGRVKQLVGEVMGDQKLHDEGNAQERHGREEPNESADIKPFDNLDKLT
jgi:uncharacterized protein YjbJ (UPF0337 family)